MSYFYIRVVGPHSTILYPGSPQVLYFSGLGGMYRLYRPDSKELVNNSFHLYL